MDRHLPKSYFTNIGKVRGSCGHKHYSEYQAERCNALDDEKCLKENGEYSDRVPNEFNSESNKEIPCGIEYNMYEEQI